MGTEIQIPTPTDWKKLTEQLGAQFSQRAAYHDQEDAFVQENYDDLKAHGYFTAMIPKELGGGGLSHAEMCGIVRLLGQHCGSTALAFSMHQHLIAANIWKYRQSKGGDDVLKKVVEKQLVLVSTGARDWLESNGTMKKVEGGYLVNAYKAFASQSSIGNVLVTSAPYEDPQEGWQILHFPVPFTSDGVEVLDNWYTLGMRGTGSHTVHLKDVFVPETAIVLKRPRGEFHPIWNVILAVAMPLIMSAYVGIAEKSAEMALESAKKSKPSKDYLPILLGEMQNKLTTAQVMLNDMVRLCNNFDFKPENVLGNEILIRKTVVAQSCIATVQKAMEIAGGQSFMREYGMERLFRDVQGAHYHPLQEKEQQVFTGQFMLGSFQ